jgi:hypothetical protein
MSPIILALIVAGMGAVMFALGCIAGRVTKKPVEVEPACEHDWEVRAVEHWFMFPHEMPLEDRKEGRHSGTWTRCLWACRRCTKRSVVRYDGRWTVEELGRRRQQKEGFASPWEDYETR